MRRLPARGGAVPGTVLVVVSILGLLLAACGSAGSVANRAPARTTTTLPPPPTSSSAPSTPAASSAPGTAPATSREQVPAFAHLFVVVMENLSQQQALAAAPIAQLAQKYAVATSYYGVAHPSLPNYLALASGSTWGTSSDCTSCYVSGPNLASQLQSAGVSWGAYFEGMPQTCFTGAESADGSYAQKHNPFVYFDDVRGRPALCNHLQPLSALTPLLAQPQSASTVPRFVWITPSMCHSGHDCSASTAGAWLSKLVASVTSSAAWREGGALVVTWDEGTDDGGIGASTGAVTSSGGGGKVLTIVAAPGVAAGMRVDTPFDHYSLLRTVEDAFGLPLLARAASPGIRPLAAFWTGG